MYGWFTLLRQAEDHTVKQLCSKKLKRERERITRGQIKGVQALHTPNAYQKLHPWTIIIETHSLFSGWGTQFWGMNPLHPPLAGKGIQLVFSTSPKTLSPDSLLHQRPSFWHQDQVKNERRGSCIFVSRYNVGKKKKTKQKKPVGWDLREGSKSCKEGI